VSRSSTRQTARHASRVQAPGRLTRTSGDSSVLHAASASQTPRPRRHSCRNDVARDSARLASLHEADTANPRARSESMARSDTFSCGAAVNSPISGAGGPAEITLRRAILQRFPPGLARDWHLKWLAGLIAARVRAAAVEPRAKRRQKRKEIASHVAPTSRATLSMCRSLQRASGELG
jgi:hypothetical protein